MERVLSGEAAGVRHLKNCLVRKCVLTLPRGQLGTPRSEMVRKLLSMAKRRGI